MATELGVDLRIYEAKNEFDCLNGIDFASTEKVNLRCDMAVLNKDNIGQVETVLAPENWKRVNFKKFSKVYNESLKKYDFSLDNLAAQLR